jgi:hypothetical protein
MNYWKHSGNHETFFFETDEEGVVWRQISIDNDRGIILTSNSNYPEEPFPLADEPLVIDDSLVPVAAEEFAQLWLNGNAETIARWSEAQAKYPAGTVVDCLFQCYVPQGVLFSSEGQTFIVDLMPLTKGARPGAKFSGIVFGYDDQNFWVKLRTK